MRKLCSFKKDLWLWVFSLLPLFPCAILRTVTLPTKRPVRLYFTPLYLLGDIVRKTGICSVVIGRNTYGSGNDRKIKTLCMQVRVNRDVMK